MENTYLPLVDVVKETSVFTVLTSIVKSTDENAYVTRLRKVTAQDIDGIDLANTNQVTLFVTTRSQHNVDNEITIDPIKWDYMISEFTPEGAEKPLEIKWLRAK